MKTLHGKPLAPGYGEGKALIYRRHALSRPPRYSITSDQVDPELARLERALDRSVADLEKLKEKVMREVGERESGILDAHLALLSDDEFISKCKERIRRELVNVEHAVTTEIHDLERLLGDLENEYLRERSKDIRDVGRRVLDQLAGNRTAHTAGLRALDDHTVIVARELLPSDTVEMDGKHVAGIVTELGGATSHATILARALGIPYIGMLSGITRQVKTGDHILVDGQAGAVTIRPQHASIGTFRKHQVRYDRASAAAEEDEREPCRTLDGVTVSLRANIGRLTDARLVAEHALDGVGLFRTECLFLNSTSRPDIRKHARAYEAVLRAIGKHPLVIRTLDLGGDKTPAFLNARGEASANMGLRGLRYSLAERYMLQTQIRAMLRTAQKGDVRCLLPMVLGYRDVEEAMETIGETAREETIDQIPPVGAMIETPAAVFEIDPILDLVDFVSLGTNDLTQFMLAADRGDSAMLGEYSVLHPSVLKAIRHVCQCAATRGKEVSVCGEAAGDPATAALLVGLGVRTLSMSPLRAARVRRMLRALRSSALEDTAQEILQCRTSIQIQEHITAMTRDAIDRTDLTETSYEFLQ